MQRIINTLVLVLLAFALFYGIIVDHNRVQSMQALEASDVELQGHKRVIDEAYRRLDLKFEGRGKHIRKMQADLLNLNTRLRVVTDSLGNMIEETNFILRQVEERLQDDIRSVSGDLRTLSDDVTTYKRRTNRTILDMREVLDRLEDDLKALDNQVNPKEGEQEAD
ncbi:MAG: hypothetical protein IH971_08870 [Candidatus Marinimicrobia bacterium]|nr:hypothetical protein [Candidatus Neomarinimicrobiota bacterium]